jgi:mRNA-degrading endonuclease RelE of RelBE toxin-antitoxin system
MPRYEPVLHPNAKRELDTLPDGLRERLTGTLKEVAETRQPTSHTSAKMLEGQPGLFRVRVGDARAICELSKPELQILACQRRADVYDGIDEIDERRVTA